MRLLESAAAGLVLLALGVVIVLALLGVAIGYLLRPLAYGERRRGIAPAARELNPAHADQRDYGDEDPGVAVPVRPESLYCVCCGHRATTLASAPTPGACPDCGGTRWGSRPDLPILGEPKELLP